MRFGYNRFYETFFPQDHTFNPSSIGLDTGVGSQDYGLPKISISGFTSFGATGSDPRGRTDQNWQFIDNFSWKLNRHAIKIGYEFRRTTVCQFFDEGFRGSLSFSTSTDFSPLENFLQGMPSGGSILEGDTNRNTYQDSHAFYVQDSFRVNHRVHPQLWAAMGLLRSDRGGQQPSFQLQPGQRSAEPGGHEWAGESLPAGLPEFRAARQCGLRPQGQRHHGDPRRRRSIL